MSACSKTDTCLCCVCVEVTGVCGSSYTLLQLVLKGRVVGQDVLAVRDSVLLCCGVVTRLVEVVSYFYLESRRVLVVCKKMNLVCGS